MPDQLAATAGDEIRLHVHSGGAWTLRLSRTRLQQLQRLFDEQSAWAQGRSLPQLRRMLAGSTAVVSAWDGAQLVGFGRASSDTEFRAVLWDVIVDQSLQNRGVGRQIIERLINHPRLIRVERVYLMTSSSAGFYSRVGFSTCHSQILMRMDRSEKR